jgi:hypothetical protein
MPTACLHDRPDSPVYGTRLLACLPRSHLTHGMACVCVWRTWPRAACRPPPDGGCGPSGVHGTPVRKWGMPTRPTTGYQNEEIPDSIPRQNQGSYPVVVRLIDGELGEHFRPAERDAGRRLTSWSACTAPTRTPAGVRTGWPGCGPRTCTGCCDPRTSSAARRRRRRQRAAAGDVAPTTTAARIPHRVRAALRGRTLSP